EEDPPLALEERDQGVDRARLERVAADEERMERQRLPEALVLYEPTHGPIDGPVGAKARELRRDAHHVREAEECRVDEALVPRLEEAAAIVHETREPLAVA